MGRLLRRAWRYLVAVLSGKLDEVSDPKVQIEQAIEEARQQHALLSQQAAAVIGNERELQLKLTRAVEETEKLQANARQALLLAEQAREAGDQDKAASYEDSARAFATRLVSAEAAMKDLHAMSGRAAQASAQARAAVETNALALQKQIAERTKLLSQLDQAKMQEQLNRAMAGMTELAAPGDTPSLDEVRDKIEGRYARAPPPRSSRRRRRQATDPSPEPESTFHPSVPASSFAESTTLAPIAWTRQPADPFRLQRGAGVP